MFCLIQLFKLICTAAGAGCIKPFLHLPDGASEVVDTCYKARVLWGVISILYQCQLHVCLLLRHDLLCYTADVLRINRIVSSLSPSGEYTCTYLCRIELGIYIPTCMLDRTVNTHTYSRIELYSKLLAFH